MSISYNENNQLLNIYKRNSNIYKRKKEQTSLSNNSKTINTKISSIITHCFSKTTKNSPRRIINAFKCNNLRNKSFNLKNYSKQISKSNLKIENSLDSTGGIDIKARVKNLNLNIKTINTNLEIKKISYESNNDDNKNENSSFNKNNKTKIDSLKNQIYEILNNKSNNIKQNYKTSNKEINSNNRINTSLSRVNERKELLNKEKITPIKNKAQYFSIKKKNRMNYLKKNDKVFNSLKIHTIKKTSYKKQNNKNNFIDKIKPKKLLKDISKNTTPKNKNEKTKINTNNKTKFNEISFNNIPKIFQFNNNSKKQTRNFNYHKKQASLSLTKTSNISQCNFLETNSLDNMLNQISNNKAQISTSNYNNSTTISNEKSSHYNNFISMYNKLIKENIDLTKENNELKQNNKHFYDIIKKENIMINVLKNIIANIIAIFKNIHNKIINKYKIKENEMKNNLRTYEVYIKQLLYYNKCYSLKESNNNKKILKIIKQAFTENKILRNLYNNLLLFDFNNARLYSNPSENLDESENKDNNKISFNNISYRSNKFLEEEKNENNNDKKRSDTVEQKKLDFIDNIIGCSHPQSRNYQNRSELNANLINDNKNLKKCFIRKLNYKKKK